jgi:hypothetical protein
MQQHFQHVREISEPKMNFLRAIIFMPMTRLGIFSFHSS